LKNALIKNFVLDIALRAHRRPEYNRDSRRREEIVAQPLARGN
jgi:hypothetical protein